MPRQDRVIDVSTFRGVTSFDTEECIVLLRARVAESAEAFKQRRDLKAWIPEAAGKEVVASEPCFLVYRLKGHAWTVIDCLNCSGERLTEVDAAALSTDLGARAIFYANSDTAGVTMYELYERGTRLERFADYEGVEFESSIRAISPPEDGPDIYDFVEAFMREQDALAPGLALHHVGWRFKSGSRQKLDFLTPELVERVDYLGA